ncbi:hypothetical protein V8B18_005843 [Pseudomonas aeruginosa]|uniref:WD40/YVTN/BNR-like repeat-containing protein n=1 Tax=Pseudomonas aeruginosa TaxID=287 RepID=UPI000AEE2DF1|nr:YCF48-related protein [Pseudomonas aeruginosa]EIU2596230.1 hypothetical protein [Pseudomonas aeruginosa]EIU2695769.1 hypothetical protein [Pseudomonas aeruginosa]EIU2844601.1 hypothetical protein [Pseudomonas aeruginosa]EIU9470897.1 hypothetical protein [Pseudomonas aeruginosa]EKV3110132.1 hypothetical protein [Pseudomonas aeruginosa]
MKKYNQPALRLLCLLSVGLAALPLSAAPLVDRLERAARISPLASESPLTDGQLVGDYLVTVGGSGHVLLRSPSGEIQQAQVPVDVLLTSVHFPDANNGWAVGHDGVVLHSTDGGKTWSKQLDGSAIRGARRIRKKSYANSSSVPATPDCSLLTGQSVSRVKR